MVVGSVAFARFAHEVARSYPVNIALHTDHCPKDKLDGFVRPLLDISRDLVDPRRGAAVPVPHVGRLGRAAEENLEIAEDLLARAAAAKIVLEIEVGVVGGEEDGVEGGSGEKLYSTTDDALATVRALGTGEKGRYLTALTFATSTASTSPATSSCAPRSSRRRRRPSSPSSVSTRARSRSTSSSTAARAPAPRTSARPSTTASSR